MITHKVEVFKMPKTIQFIVLLPNGSQGPLYTGAIKQDQREQALSPDLQASNCLSSMQIQDNSQQQKIKATTPHTTSKKAEYIEVELINS